MNELSPVIQDGANPEQNARDRLRIVLFDALTDVRWVIHYAASRSIELPLEVMNPLLSTLNKVDRKEEFSVEEEVKFWTAYRQASEAIRPATIDSIRNILNKGVDRSPIIAKVVGPRSFSMAEVLVNKYSLLTVVALFLLVLTQIYWVIGWNILKDIAKNYDFLTTPGLSFADQKTYTDWLQGNVSALIEWLRYVPFVSPPDAKAPSVADAKSLLISSVNVLEVLSNFILPLLYGWIGAIAFSLRSVERSIKDFVLRRSSQISLSLRLILGPLAGLAAGWLVIGAGVDQEVFSGAAQTNGQPVGAAATKLIGSLPTIASLPLAFAAGYSVELIFAALDRLISAFGGSPNRDTAKDTVSSDVKQVN